MGSMKQNLFFIILIIFGKYIINKNFFSKLMRFFTFAIKSIIIMKKEKVMINISINFIIISRQKKVFYIL